jgi:hypothetical protein
MAEGFNRGGGASGGSAVTFGDTHNHFGTNMNRRDVERALDDHHDVFKKRIRQWTRDGAFA